MGSKALKSINRMKPLLKYLLCTAVFITPSTYMKCQVASLQLPDYQNWYKVVEKLVTRECDLVNLNLDPNGADERMEGKNELEYFMLVNLNDNRRVADSLMAVAVAKTVEIVIIESYVFGFNAWHCTNILLQKKGDSNLEGVEICQITPDATPKVLAKEPARTKKSAYDPDEFEELWNKRSGMFSMTSFYVITRLTPEFKIKECKVILYP
jgi:hypothetical protein